MGKGEEWERVSGEVFGIKFDEVELFIDSL